ncbi:DEAD/DEAH box helicase [Ruminococcus flavefaciens]|uniref:DEAD/DEAH box helicase n=1 Tax=Ruminococcus flavefaciens TaxID=1265 RepID=UPI00030E6D9E|nr:DEAD/DEAH box helicase [Ruminococcus flavefaciens]
MNANEIVTKVQEWINSSMILSDKLPISSSDNIKSGVAIRMMNAYRRYRIWQNSENTIDFECALRNYLLSFNTDIHINGYNPTFPNSFGLVLNAATDRIYANYDLPDYVNQKFIRNVFSGLSVMKYDDKDNSIKAVNSYIYELTNHRFSKFKSVEQQLAVMGSLRVPQGYTALVAMSTGGGKSLITQTVSYQNKDSLTLIIVPTISLMLDQCRNAKDIIKPANLNEIMYYHSGCDVDGLVERLLNHSVRMLFISPEAIIKNKKLQSNIFKANKSGYLQNLIVDEAHIIIEWGTSFRVDFQCLDSFRKLLIKDNPLLRTFLLSATYSKKTVENLKMFYSDDERWIEIRLDTLRKEPRFDIVKCSSYTDKHNKMIELVRKLPHPMIIYVNTPNDAEKIRDELSDTGFNNTRMFTGRTSSSDREKIIDEWVQDRFDLMIATCAFGVGVDKRDVRTVLHTYVPSGPNQYYQECGRGGRDGQPCLSTMLFTEDDINVARSMTQKVLTVEKLSGRWFSMLNSDKTNKKLAKVIMDTSVKPDYNEKDSFYIEASNADITWNVYVILLLRRAGLLNIVEVNYVDDKYIFVVSILDQRIMFKNDAAFELFNSIREDESKSIYNEINELTSKLYRVGKICWSSMFNDVYLLTDEYCAGCNNHENLKTEKHSNFPLKKPIVYPLAKANSRLSEIMSYNEEMLIISKDKKQYMIKALSNAGADIIVMPNDKDCSFMLLEETNEFSAQTYMDYSEFFELCRMRCNYFLSGCIVFYVDDDQELAADLLNITASKEYKRVYLVSGDFFVPKRNKNISELVNGVCKFDYIIEKELI